MIVSIGELGVASVLPVGKLDYPIDIADGNGWWYAIFGGCSYLFDAALPVLPEEKDKGHAGDGVACVFYVRGSVSGGRNGQAEFAHNGFDSRHFH